MNTGQGLWIAAITALVLLLAVPLRLLEIRRKNAKQAKERLALHGRPTQTHS